MPNLPYEGESDDRFLRVLPALLRLLRLLAGEPLRGVGERG